jgi:hypothetical protein
MVGTFVLIGAIAYLTEQPVRMQILLEITATTGLTPRDPALKGALAGPDRQ